MKTYNVKLQFDSEVDRQAIVDLLSRYRLMCNKTSEIIFPKQDNLNLKHIHDVCYHKIKKQFPYMPVQTIIKSYKDVAASYKTIQSNKHKIEKPISKHNLSLRLDKRLYSKFSKESIHLSCLTKNKRIRARFQLYKQVKELFDKYETTDPLLFIRNDEIFLSITFKIPEINPKDDSILGIDLGLRRLVTTSDGNMISSKELLKTKRRIRRNKRKLQETKDTKKSKSAKRKLKKLKRKERNFNKNYIHHLANKVLETDKSIIVLEDLSKIKQNTSKTKEGYKRKKHNNRMSQIPFYLFLQVLTYKALHKGKRVVTVNPKNTSKKDSRGLKDGIRKGCRYYAVDGNVLDADWNASINIAKKYSKHPISFETPFDGDLNLIGRLFCQPTDSRDFS